MNADRAEIGAFLTGTPAPASDETVRKQGPLPCSLCRERMVGLMSFNGSTLGEWNVGQSLSFLAALRKIRKQTGRRRVDLCGECADKLRGPKRQTEPDYEQGRFTDV